MSPALRTTIYLWKCTFMGFLIGLDVAWMLTRNTWLDMRMETGLVIPAFAAAGLGLGVYSALRPKRLGRTSSKRMGYLVLLIQIGAALALGWDALLILPAALIRGFLPGFPTLAAINMWLMAVLAVGIPALFFDPDRYCHNSDRCGG